MDAVVLVTVQVVDGSGPREPGAWMVVDLQGFTGTVGGGQLEFDAIGVARDLLAHPAEPFTRRYALGPSLGQCCGGVVHLRFERLHASQAAAATARLQPRAQPVALFGGGHVGHAIVRACADLPFALTWIDSRDGVFPSALPANVLCEHSDPVQAAVRDLAPGSLVLVMSFSHAEDLDIVAACLQRRRERRDLPFVGLIGSKSKWAAFRHRLEARGFDAAEHAGITCPIGVPGIIGKEPAVIAAAAVAQLLQQRTLHP
ncbi:xanthine dehydrogenase accessory protein XdhC [Ramlibacter algicola]|uniref:Xanthine dehydrogenase accessory protein XdhC n=1 Tax=Ramlibacter algicola TaxID=2795217 RepID=A0A934UQP4_9BURK|nr:xanthine dehydrogenase accessory protein XdhC [Ramlibacter algicola]MBK0391853.1 xanthine dehydrogenase accessory protein XdhC [Ramlibacter algicola]